GVIVPIHLHSEGPVAHVGSASRGVRAGFGFGESGQKHRGKNGNDGDDNEQLDQGKSAARIRRNAGRVVHATKRVWHADETLMGAGRYASSSRLPIWVI